MKQFITDVFPTVAVVSVSYVVLEYLHHVVIMGYVVPWMINAGWMVAGSTLIPGLLLGLAVIAVSVLMFYVVKAIKNIRNNTVTAVAA